MALFISATCVRAQIAPDVVTLAAGNIVAVGTNAGATLNGSVNPNGADSTAWFEWGNSTSYGNVALPQNIGNGTSTVFINAALTNLTPGFTYHYRCVASNSFGVGRGADQSFWSPAIMLNSPNPMTNECHVPFIDPTTVNAAPHAIAAGGYHSLALKADGRVVSWGRQTITPAGATNVVAIAVGDFHSLALKADGRAISWGILNNFGQTNTPASATNVMAIAAGSSHSLVLKTNGTVVGWGNNSNGQTNTPASVTNVVAIAAGGAHNLALNAGGTVIGWGYNGTGQTLIPVPATNVVGIEAGGSQSLALEATGTVIGWGSNSFGQTNTPASVTNVVAIAAGGSHNLALRADGTVVAWGNNSYGQTTIPVSASNIVAIAAGGSYSLALKADGAIIGWGRNEYGQTNIPADVYQLNFPITVSGTVDVNVPGTYLLNYSTTNSLGAVGTASRTVVVVDTLPPVLTLLGSNPLMQELGAPFVDPGASATDLCSGDRTGSIFVWGTVNPNAASSYPLLYVVTDTSGNLAVTDRTVVVVTRPALTGPSHTGNGAFQFTFTNTPGARFNVLASTNVAQPLSEWTVLGPVTENSPGLFQFMDVTATNRPVRYYRLRWP